MRYRTKRTDVLKVGIGHELNSLQVNFVVAQDLRVLSQSHVAQKLPEVGGSPHGRPSPLTPLVGLAKALTLYRRGEGTAGSAAQYVDQTGGGRRAGRRWRGHKKTQKLEHMEPSDEQQD